MQLKYLILLICACTGSGNPRKLSPDSKFKGDENFVLVGASEASKSEKVLKDDKALRFLSNYYLFIV